MMRKSCSVVARSLTLGVLIVFVGVAASQQAYPTKPIRFITPYAPGGTTSILARLVGQKLTERWGQQVIVDNRPGGNTVIGTEALVKSPPDGYTILLMSSAHVLNPFMIPDLPYDVIKDFAPVATLTSTEFVLVLHPSVPANNLQEFIALAKSRPGQLNHASSGLGSSIHLGIELFNIMTGVKIQNIPYKGGGPVITDLLGGQVQLALQIPISVIPLIKGGKLKAIAVTGTTRLSALPEVPTFTEGGLPGFDVRTWYGILAPARTPIGIIDRLSTEITRMLSMPDFKEELGRRGMSPLISSPDQMDALMKADMVRFAKVIKAANIKLEQ